MKTTPQSPRTTGNLRNQIFRIAAVSLLALGAILPGTARAVAPSSGIPFLDVLADARHLASLNANWSVFMVKGDSMEPLFGKDSVLVIEKSDFDTLRAGMNVIYKDADGDYVAHRLMERTDKGWTVMGQSNSKKDPGLVTPDNFQGAVFCMLHYKDGTDTLSSVAAAAKPTLALAKRY